MSLGTRWLQLALLVLSITGALAYSQEAIKVEMQPSVGVIESQGDRSNPFRNQGLAVRIPKDSLTAQKESADAPKQIYASPLAAPSPGPQPSTPIAPATATIQALQSPKIVEPTVGISTDEITHVKIDQRLEALQANSELDESAKAEITKRYKAAQDSLRMKEEARQNAASYQASAREAPALLAQAKKSLSQPAETASVAIPENASLAQIEQLSTDADAKLKAAQASLANTEKQLQERLNRKSEIAKLSEELKQRLEETRIQLKTLLVEEHTPQNQARKIELESRLFALESQLLLFKAEAAKHEAFTDILPLLREVAKREKTLVESEVVEWQRLVGEFRKRESAKQAAEARLQVQNAHPALRSLAERNATLAEQRKSLVDSMTHIEGKVTAVEKRVEELQNQYRKAEQRVRKAGHSTTVGLMLRRQKESLPSVRECRQTLHEIQVEMPKANLAQIEVEEERELLGDIETLVPQILENLKAETKGNRTEQLEPTIRDLLTTKFELLGSLATDYETYLDELSDLEISNGKLMNQIAKSSSYIGEHVLWIRSVEPLGIGDLTQATEGLLAVSSPESWFEVAKYCGLDTMQRPLQAFGVLLIVILIIGFHAKLRAKMVAVCAAKTGVLQFRPTLQAVGLAAVVATEWPLLLAYLGWRMSFATVAGGMTVALGTALLYAAVLLWVCDFVKHVCRLDGLAESHLGWSKYSTKLIRTELRWLTLLGIPMAIVAVGMQVFQDGEWSDSLGRIAFVAAMLLLANFLHSILNSKDNVLREAISLETGTWFSRLRQVSYAIGVGVPTLLAVLAVAGFYYSAQQVALRWQATLGVSLALLFSYSVATRWCLVKRRNLAMSQAKERQRLAAVESATSESTAMAPAIQIEDQQPDLSAIHEQLRYLLRHATIVGMAVCTWFIWADVLPALKVLDGVVLWEKMADVTEMQEGPDGISKRITTQQPVTTTLRHAMFAGVLVLGTFVIGRNLPALLEVTLLQRIPCDKGGRHAISVLLKYSVALAGIFLACRTLSFTWSSVQWLAAGMTVGLGFGLQEIFANFVSGLILLLERPIRVGDVITLGDVTGTVTNIRIRATTVTNWDRKELIVPNKDLITGRLLNWTLTDTTNRIVITVGVAYRSDPRQARELILNAVTSHANVLVEPAPNVTFEEFADSALNLVVRCYIANMDVRLSTVNDLHTAIHTALREAGVEIAFPQRDIHVRGLEALPALNGVAGLREAA